SASAWPQEQSSAGALARPYDPYYGYGYGYPYALTVTDTRPSMAGIILGTRPTTAARATMGTIPTGAYWLRSNAGSRPVLLSEGWPRRRTGPGKKIRPKSDCRTVARFDDPFYRATEFWLKRMIVFLARSLARDLTDI